MQLSKSEDDEISKPFGFEHSGTRQDFGKPIPEKEEPVKSWGQQISDALAPQHVVGAAALLATVSAGLFIANERL